MTILNRLERGLEFLKAHSWGQMADRQECKESDDGYSYCARGAVVFGGFTEALSGYCEQHSRFHDGPCIDNDYGECVNTKRHPLGRELVDVMYFFDDVAKEVSGKSYAGVTWYNDALIRSKEDIIALFERAIAKAREQANE